MALIKCRECRKDISNNAKNCPQCGVKLHKPIPVFTLMLLTATSFWGISFVNDYYDSSPVFNTPNLQSIQQISLTNQRHANELAINTDTDEEWQKIAWIDKGKDLVRFRMKDPSSAEFRNEYFNRGELGTPVSCGEVNAKNGFSAYIGFQRYISAGSEEFTFIESEVVDFDTLWRTLCL